MDVFTRIVSPDENNVIECADILQEGGIIAFPTETVYGLGAVYSIESAVKNVFIAKGRPSDNPLIVHIYSLDQIAYLVSDIYEDAEVLMKHYFPGPLTLLFPKHPQVPSIVTAGQSTIAIRMPNNAIALELIKKTGLPLVAPSANTSGRPSPTTAQHVFDDLSGKIEAIIDGGPCEVGIESTVVGWINEKPTIFRPGIISKQEIEEILGKTVVYSQTEDKNAPLSPGMKYRHYAPSIPIILCNSIEETKTLLSKEKEKLFILTDNEYLFSHSKHYVKSLDFHSLYANFRFAEVHDFHKIVIALTSPASVNPALYNRITKAVSH